MSRYDSKRRSSACSLPPSVNFHLLKACNFDCKFCFAVFEDSAEYLGKGQLPLESQLEILRRLAQAGVEKITFAGGEPTLSPQLPRLLAESKKLGMVTMVVTNGSRLHQVGGDKIYPHLDWLVLSVDSVTPETNVEAGRADKRGGVLSPGELVSHAEAARRRGVRIKLNTVVHRLNLDESMVEFVEALRPERWKIFQVLPVEDQNGAHIDQFRIEEAEFTNWLERHRAVEGYGVEMVSEANDEMRGTYAMIDPAGRFYDSSLGRHSYSEPILTIGVDAAFQQVSFARDAYEDRGGVYDWAPADMPRFVAFAGVSGAGKDAAASALLERGFRRIAIADPLKFAAKELWQLEDAQLWGEQRDVVDPRWGTTPRRLYQRLGDAMRRIDPDIWVKLWRQEVEAALAGGERVVCPDVRMPREVETARELGAVTLLILRPGAGAPGGSAEHPTEKSASALQRSDVDIVVRNDGTIDELLARVEEALHRAKAAANGEGNHGE